MPEMKVVPHLRVLGSDYDPNSDDFEGWSEYIDYHIGAPDEQSNNSYIGGVIRYFQDYVSSNAGMYWVIEYFEVSVLQTNAGQVALPGKRFYVTDVETNGEYDPFQDRNSDGQCELNCGIPVYPEYPRFLTEHDVAANPGAVDPTTIMAGDYVRVSDPAYCSTGGEPNQYVDKKFFGKVCKVINPSDAYENAQVEHPEIKGLTNVIHRSFLTKVNPDGSELTVDDDDVSKPKNEHAPGEEVEGEDEPDDTLHISDGDVITVHDEYGHEKKLRISVV